MKPLFRQEIEMLYNLGYDGIELKEDLFWVDNNIIKYIDKETKEKIKICRKLVNDELKVSFKKYKIPKDYVNKIETWEESINSNLETLNNLEQNSLSVIRNNTKENYEKIGPLKCSQQLNRTTRGCQLKARKLNLKFKLTKAYYEKDTLESIVKGSKSYDNIIEKHTESILTTEYE